MYGITGRTFCGEHCDIGFEEPRARPTRPEFVSPSLSLSLSLSLSFYIFLLCYSVSVSLSLCRFSTSCPSDHGFSSFSLPSFARGRKATIGTRPGRGRGWNLRVGFVGVARFACRSLSPACEFRDGFAILERTVLSFPSLSLSLSLSLCSLKFSLWLGLCFVSNCIGRILKYTVLDDVDDL